MGHSSTTAGDGLRPTAGGFSRRSCRRGQYLVNQFELLDQEHIKIASPVCRSPLVEYQVDHRLGQGRSQLGSVIGFVKTTTSSQRGGQVATELALEHKLPPLEGGGRLNGALQEQGLLQTHFILG
jgi:hypothetical protein